MTTSPVSVAKEVPCRSLSAQGVESAIRFAARLFSVVRTVDLLSPRLTMIFSFRGPLRAGLSNSKQSDSSLEEVDARGVYLVPCDNVSPPPFVEDSSRGGEKFLFDREVSSPPFARHGCCWVKGAKARRKFRLLLLRFGGKRRAGSGREHHLQRSFQQPSSPISHGLASALKRAQPQVDVRAEQCSSQVSPEVAPNHTRSSSCNL